MPSRIRFAFCLLFSLALAVVNCTSWGEFWSLEPAVLSVTNSAGATIASGSTVTFGSVGMGAGGSTKTLTFRIVNSGDSELKISSIDLVPATTFSVLGATSFAVSGNNSSEVKIRYTPATASDGATVTFTSNAGNASFNLTGGGTNVGTGLSFWLKLNGNMLDSSGLGNNGAAVGTGITYGPDRNGNAGSAGVFDGTGQGGNYVAVNLGSGWAWNSTYSMSAWVRTANASGASLLARQQTGVGSARLDFGYYPGNYRVSRDAFSAGGWATVDMPATIEVDVWTHLVFVSNAGNITVYRNGISVGTGVVAGSPTAGSNSVDIGVGILLPSLIGSLADMHVYNATALTAMQAQALYNQD